MRRTRHSSGGTRSSFCGAWHHDSSGHVSYPAFRLTVRQSEHDRSYRMGRRILSRIAECDQKRARPQRRAGIILTASRGLNLTLCFSVKQNGCALRALIAHQPTTALDLREKILQRKIEQRRFLKIDGVAGFWKDHQAGRWNCTLEK